MCVSWTIKCTMSHYLMFVTGSRQHIDKAILRPKCNQVDRTIKVQLLDNHEGQTIKHYQTYILQNVKIEKGHLPTEPQFIFDMSCLFPGTIIPRQNPITNTRGLPVICSFANRGILFYVHVFFILYTQGGGE